MKCKLEYDNYHHHLYRKDDDSTSMHAQISRIRPEQHTTIANTTRPVPNLVSFAGEYLRGHIQWRPDLQNTVDSLKVTMSRVTMSASRPKTRIRHLAERCCRVLGKFSAQAKITHLKTTWKALMIARFCGAELFVINKADIPTLIAPFLVRNIFAGFKSRCITLWACICSIAVFVEGHVSDRRVPCNPPVYSC